jgi:hypothetical protein
MEHKFSSSPFFAPFLHIISAFNNSLSLKMLTICSTVCEAAGGWDARDFITMCTYMCGYVSEMLCTHRRRHHHRYSQLRKLNTREK